MMKWIVPIVFSVICAFATQFWQTHEFATRKVIYIRQGEPVLADSVTESDQFVFYEVNGKSGMFMRNDVASVGSVQVERTASLLQIIDRHKNRLAGMIGSSGKLLRRIDTRLLIFLFMLAVSIGIMKLASVLRLKAKATPAPASPLKTPTTTPDNRGAALTTTQKSSELRDIVLFFVELYRLQNGLPEETPFRFSMTPESARRKMKVFELGIKGSSDWLTRRMSIGPLGEETGSKSKCFYVIYDTHMVVKIPPVPVTDMAKYTTDIRREVKIATQLAPVACIVPMVSVVLKKFKKLPFESSLTPEQLEKQYIRLVEDHPEYQEYLTVGGRFAFFMELSNSFFLGRVIDERHESKEKIADEIQEAPDMAWDQAVFTTRYGLESLPVFEGIQAVFRLCEVEAMRIIREAGQAASIHAYQIKDWFLTAITGSEQWDCKGLDETLVDSIKAAFSTVFNANQSAVDALIHLLKQQLAIKTFSKSRNQIENIASNMLLLLCQLKAKRVALRDLKPDNLFLDANPDDYPVFLNDRNDFSIGVIDVETAVSLDPTPNGTVAQPLLGGTPLYATPLHVLRNETITAFFGKPAELLHLQDWFATIAIIFKTITGTNLFPRAARSFPEILKILKAGRSKSDPGEATVKAMSQKFWSAAATDMKIHLAAATDILNRLTLQVPEDLTPDIIAELEREQAGIERAIRNLVKESQLLRGERNKSFLLKATGEEILRQQDRWQHPADLPAAHQKVAPQMVAFLEKLARLKQGAERKNKAIAELSESPAKANARILLEAMFQIVFRRMYKADWNVIAKPQPGPAPAVPKSDSQEQATVVLDSD